MLLHRYYHAVRLFSSATDERSCNDNSATDNDGNDNNVVYHVHFHLKSDTLAVFLLLLLGSSSVRRTQSAK